MPKSKHRRKGKTRARTAPPSGPTFDDPERTALLADAGSGGASDDPDDDSAFEEALAQAEEALAADLAAADFDDLDDEEAADFDDAITPLLQAVEEQVRTHEPPEVAATLGRLVASGHARDEAISLIGAVLMFELNDVMQNDRAFDPMRYAARLAALPKRPDFD